MNDRLKIGIEAITKAGEYLRKKFLQKHRVSIKKDSTVLLGEDLKSEEILLTTISKYLPQDSFFTEESEMKLKNDNVWVFDPLCGSYSYLRGVETWSISVAYISEESYVIGLVYQPYTNNLFFSEKGKGAYMNKNKIAPSKIKSVSDAFISIEHGVFKNKKVKLTNIINKMKRLRVGHGSGGELSYVASGFLDAVIKTDQTLMHFAGGRAIIEEAGGVFVDFLGNYAPTYFNKNKIINYVACSNSILLKEILSYL